MEYEKSPGEWRSLTREFKWKVSDIYRWHEELYGLAEIPDRWIFNDFGPIAIRYYRDKNSNSRLDGKETLEGEMIHTTPYNEAESAKHNGDPRKVDLDESHGCIHVRPVDLRAFLDAGAFRPRMSLIIHRYDERYRPANLEKQ